jgi:hypothetical protein
MTPSDLPANPANGAPARSRRREVVLWVGVALFGAIVGVAVLRVWERAHAAGTTTELRSTPSVIVAVRDLARLEGAEFQIERVISLKDKQSRFFGLVDSEDAILLVASGTVTAGVDLTSLADGDIVVDPARHTATLTLPPSRVLSSRLDNQRTFVFKRETDLLAQRGESLETRARQEAERTLVAAAEEGKIVERSNDNVRRTVETLVRSLGYTTVTVSFRAGSGAQ